MYEPAGQLHRPATLDKFKKMEEEKRIAEEKEKEEQRKRTELRNARRGQSVSGAALASIAEQAMKDKTTHP